MNLPGAACGLRRLGELRGFSFAPLSRKRPIGYLHHELQDTTPCSPPWRLLGRARRRPVAEAIAPRGIATSCAALHERLNPMAPEDVESASRSRSGSPKRRPSSSSATPERKDKSWRHHRAALPACRGPQRPEHRLAALRRRGARRSASPRASRPPGLESPTAIITSEGRPHRVADHGKSTPAWKARCLTSLLRQAQGGGAVRKSRLAAALEGSTTSARRLLATTRPHPGRELSSQGEHAQEVELEKSGEMWRGQADQAEATSTRSSNTLAPGGGLSRREEPTTSSRDGVPNLTKVPRNGRVRLQENACCAIEVRRGGARRSQS